MRRRFVKHRIDSVHIDSCVGKTIRSVVVATDDDQMVLVFTDGTLSQITAASDDNIADITSGFDVCSDDYNLDKLLSAGAIVKERFDEIKAKADEASAKKAAEVEEAERKQFERLKAKFEQGTSD